MTRAQKRLLTSMDTGDGTAYQLDTTGPVLTSVGDGVRCHRESTAMALVDIGVLETRRSGRNDTTWSRVTAFLGDASGSR